MDHATATDLLTDFVAGGLAGARRAELEEHLGHCETCRAWVGTYLLLAESLGSEAGARLRHPSSLELSTLAVAPETLEARSRERARRHLESCSECRELVALARRSVLGARPRRPGRGRVRRLAAAVTASLGPPARLAWVAGAALVIAVLTVFYATLGAPERRHLTGVRLEGTKTIEAPDALLVEATEVQSGAAVSFRARRVVAFGDRFSVQSGASLSVLIDDGGTRVPES